MLGIDIGTTNVKAALYSFSGKEILVESSSYSLHTDEEGAAIQDANEIKENVFLVIQKITAECQNEGYNISMISFSSAMHSLLAVNEQGKAISPVMTWGDRRAESYVEQLKNKTGTELYHRTGTPIHPMSPLVKFLWLQEEQPEIMEKAHRFLGIKSYILYQLFNEYYTDYSIASATGLFNMYTLDWDDEALTIAGVSSNQLPKLVPTTEFLTGINNNIATNLGLPADVKIVIGASDGTLSNLGVGALEPDTMALSIGTSGAIRSVTEKPHTDNEERTFCYALTRDHWVIGGPVNNGGVVLDWARTKFDVANYEALMQKIETIKPGADGLFFYPYLVGERAPIWRADVKGAFFGLDIHQKKEHMLRAVLEGINFNLYAVYQTITEVIGDQADELLVTGGFIKSPTWIQMLADIFGIDMVITDVTENACFGAVLLGLQATGEIDDFSTVSEMMSTTMRYVPDEKRHHFYQNHFIKYQKINDHLLEMHDDI